MTKGGGGGKGFHLLRHIIQRSVVWGRLHPMLTNLEEHRKVVPETPIMTYYIQRNEMKPSETERNQDHLTIKSLKVD